MTNKKTETEQEATIQEPVYSQADLDRAALEITKLTPEAYLELEDLIRSLEEQPSLPEAGGIAWADLYGKHGGVIHLTARRSDVIPAIHRLLAGVRYLREKQPDVDWTPHRPESNLPVTYLPSVQATQPAQATASEAASPAHPLPEEPQYTPDQLATSSQEAQATQAPAATGVMVMDIETINIIPQPEGRCNVDLFAAGHQYADLRIVRWTNESVAKVINIDVPEINLIQPQAFKGKFRAEYVFSQKLSSSGKPYKNVTRVTKL